METSKQYAFCEAARFLNIPRSSFANWIKLGKVKYQRVSSLSRDFNLFTESDLLEFKTYLDSIMPLTEIAKKYNLAESMIRSSIRAGYLPARKYLRVWWCEKADVIKWLDKRAKGILRTHKGYPQSQPVQSIEKINKPTLEELIQKLTSVLEGLL